MPARVEYRLGSIFDEECDLLVIPSGVRLAPSTASYLHQNGIPFPDAAPWGATTLKGYSSRHGAVVYATVGGPRTTADVVQTIGARIGSLVARLNTGAQRRLTLSSLLDTEIGAPSGGIDTAGEQRIFGMLQNSSIAKSIQKVAAPLLGAEAGALPATSSAAALERGFLSTAPDGVVLTISVARPENLEVLQGRRKVGGDATLQQNIAHIKRFLASVSKEQPLPEARSAEALGSRAQSPAAPPVEERSNPPTRAVVPVQKRTRIFISYSHEDAKWLKELQKHLKPLERGGALVWDDTRLKAGSSWREEIRQALGETRVAVLLVSAAFMASDFIDTDELPPLLAAAEQEGATILPVIISASSFLRTPSLSRFQSVNNPEKPLAQLRKANREKVMDDVARAVADALDR